MSNSKNVHKLSDINRIDPNEELQNEEEGQMCDATRSCTYAVTVSKKPSQVEESNSLCAGQKSFISIHSTDHLCQVNGNSNEIDLAECNVEVISLNEVFPSTSEESLSNEDEMPPQRKRNAKVKSRKGQENVKYVSTNSHSSNGPKQKDVEEIQSPGYSDFDIPKSTMYVVGSNPGEPKISYQDTPKKISKTMKKFLRNIDKHKNDLTTKSGEKAISKLTTMRGILKDNRCGPECTGDSVQGLEDFTDTVAAVQNLDIWPQNSYSQQNPNKNVTFNTQVVIVHFTGDLCVGQSVETLSKEKDQQARNSELRKTLITKYNESWPSNK